jgi:hypothetical protein
VGKSEYCLWGKKEEEEKGGFREGGLLGLFDQRTLRNEIQGKGMGTATSEARMYSNTSGPWISFFSFVGPG